MIRKWILGCLVLVSTQPGSPAADELRNSLNSVVQAERDFAALAAEKGIREAFLTCLAEDSIVFRPGPVPGRKWYEEHQPSEGLLAWYPSVAEVASSADLGYTTGPWEFRPDATKPDPLATGIYFTVWKRQPEGGWKAVIDIGVRTEGAQKLPAFDSAASSVDADSASANSLGASENLFAADREFFAHASSTGAAQAYAEYAAPDLMLIREPAGLLQGRAAVEASKQPFSMSGEPMGGQVSSAGDLGYTYGSCELKAAASGAAPAKGHYMRVWRKSHDARWQVAVDLLCPLPPPPPPSQQ
ncbi:MAG: DUF4440 domain-containing protein [Acidobacteriota bacterium]